jgi:hypothetical protein
MPAGSNPVASYHQRNHIIQIKRGNRCPPNRCDPDNFDTGGTPTKVIPPILRTRIEQWNNLPRKGINRIPL